MVGDTFQCSSPLPVLILILFSPLTGLGHDGLDRPGDMLDRDSYQNAPRQKRMRTSFKHHQLRTLKSYFAVNHNPDAKDLKHLAQKTGLTKRVLQVRQKIITL